MALRYPLYISGLQTWRWTRTTLLRRQERARAMARAATASRPAMAPCWLVGCARAASCCPACPAELHGCPAAARRHCNGRGNLRRSWHHCRRFRHAFLAEGHELSTHLAEPRPVWGYLQGGPGNLEPYLFCYPFIRPPALGRGEEAASLRRQLGGVLRRHRLCYRRLSHRVVCIVCASQLETLALGLADNNTVAYTNTVDFPGTLDPVDRDARKVSSRCVPWNSSFVVS